MASLMTRSLIVLLCWAMVGVCSAEDSSVDDFLGVYLGRYDNSKNNAGGQPLVQLRIEVVSVESLNGPVIYLEEAVEGRVVLAIVCEVSALPTGNGVRLTSYNATQASDYEFDQFDVDDLDEYDTSRFQLYEGCPSDYIRVSDRYVGTWVKCRGADANGEFTKFIVVSGEDAFEFITSGGELALQGAQAYRLARI